MNENNKSLQQKLIEYFGTQRIESTSLPSIITNNLNPKFKLRPYQNEPLSIFLIIERMRNLQIIPANTNFFF